MKLPIVWRSTHETEVASVLRRCKAWEHAVAAARKERDAAVSVAQVLETELRHAAPAARRERDEAIAKLRTFADRNLRQAVKIERLEHDLAEARGTVDASTWGWQPPTEEAS